MDMAALMVYPDAPQAVVADGHAQVMQLAVPVVLIISGKYLAHLENTGV